MTLATSTENITRTLQGRRHLVELQSLRGIAALIVALFHCGIYYQISGAPLALVGWFNAPAAVISFFVLSGFVLTLSQIDRPMAVGDVLVFYTRRVFRIFPALWLACLIAVIYQLVARHTATEPLVSRWWDAQIHREGLSPKMLMESLIGKGTELTLPIWTLNVELVGSLIMPLFIWAFLRSRWAVVALTLAFAMASVLHASSFSSLAAFMASFGLGCLTVGLVARRRDPFLSPVTAYLLAIMGVAALWFGRTLFGLLADNPYGPVEVIVSSGGAVCLIAALCACRRAFAILAHPALAWFGDVSYSFYLLHMPIMGFAGLALVRVLGPAGVDGLPLRVVLLTVITVVISSGAATLAYRFIEVPGIRIGKAVVAHMSSALTGSKSPR